MEFKYNKKLCIFHLDFNYSCLREDYLCKWLKKISDAGYNAVLWEIEDKVQLETCSRCVYPEAYTKEQFRNILDYSRELGLEPIPLLQTVGHAEYILMHEEYRHLRESNEENHHDCYCTENPEVREFLKNIIDEYLELFGKIRYFHLGGDEAYVFATCPECKEKAGRIGKNALYMEHIAALSKSIFSAGARPGIWGDMILHHPQEMKAIPKDYIIWDWNYTDSDNAPEFAHIWGNSSVKAEDVTEETKHLFPEIIDPESQKIRPFYTTHALKRMGYDIILCSAVRAAGDSVFFPKARFRSQNVVGAARVCTQLDLLGNCVTSWAIRLNAYEAQETMLPFAPEVLTAPCLSQKQVERIVSKRMFGVSSTAFFDAVNTASDYMPPFICAGSLAIQWNSLKDSLPPPNDYLESLLKRWKEEDDGSRFAFQQEQLYKAEKGILQSLSMLMDFMLEAKLGFDILDYWFKALWMQLCIIKAGKQILKNQITPETTLILNRLKEQFHSLLLKSETPGSAEKNSNLVFDWLVKYSRRNCK